MGAHFERSLILAGLVAALSACAGDGGASYPSLAMRPFESGEAPAPAVPVTSPPPNRSPISPARIAELRAAANDSHAAFTRKEPAAERLARAAAGQSIESGARAAALVALSDLDAQRGRTAVTLAAVDALAAEAASALSPDPALGAAQTEIAALLARQDEGIARLWEVMGS